MKIQLLTSLLLATATLAWAVPSEINYQGRLTDANGDAVTGDVAMSLKMFDAATEGNEIYSEDIGTVTLDSNGIYSFEFGASGQSVVSTSESIATTDGTNSIINATLENLPVDGSVSISDGTYTWSQANGSSSSAEFTASVTPSSGAVSAIYLGSTPSSIVDITASYNYMDATLSGALSSHASHWLELSVDGIAQSPRERVLSVPFAQVAGNIMSEDYQSEIDKLSVDYQSKIGKLTGEIAHLIPRSISKSAVVEIDSIREIPVNSSNATTIELQTYVRSFIIQHRGGNNTNYFIFNYQDGSNETVTTDSDSDYFETVPDPNRNSWDWDYRVWGENPYPEKIVSSVITDGLRPSDGYRYNIISVTLEAVENHVILFNFGETLSSGEWIVGYQDDDLHSKNEYGDISLSLEDNTGNTIVSGLKQGSRFHLYSNTYIKDVVITVSLAENPDVEGNCDPKIRSVSFYKVE